MNSGHYDVTAVESIINLFRKITYPQDDLISINSLATLSGSLPTILFFNGHTLKV